MKKIELSQGKCALVDDEDFEYLNQWKWHAHVGKNSSYARRNKSIGHGKQTAIQMHRVIMNTPIGLDVDHINGDGLDNRQVNLRNVTRKQNTHNRNQPSKYRSSEFKGVSKHTMLHGSIRWRARICVDWKNVSLGVYDTKTEAAEAYNVAALKYYGEYARLNKIGVLV